MQWGFDGRPTWFAPRVTGFFLTVAIALCALGIGYYSGARGWALNAAALILLGVQILHLVLLRRWLRGIETRDPVLLLATMAAVASEELAYRGVLTDLASGPLGPTAGAIASAAAFGVGHAAQGWWGVVFSAGYGLALQGLVVVSGGLALAMAAHLAYDLVAAALGRRLGKRTRGP